MRRPNILLIYPDQMRADALGCAGNDVIRTSHMDRLAAEGVRFTNAYTSFPLCCPFRASVMTGKYAHSNGMFANHYPVPLDQEFLAQILADNGYRTGYFGKWHLNGGYKHSFVPPEERLGFETFVGFSRGHRYLESIFYRNDDPRPRVSRRFEPEYQTDHLIEFTEEDDDRPFFGMICYGLPHPPLAAPDHYLNMYAPEDVPVAANTPDDSESRKQARWFLARYYGLVTAVDDSIGRLLGHLEQTGLAENTLVLMVSDHGEMAGEHDRHGKKVWYRSSMQVPMIARLPGRFQAGQIVEQLVDGGVDIMPTLLDLCGIDIPDAVQGVSFRSLLEGDTAPVRDAIHYEVLTEKEGPEKHPVGERGIRTKAWLYVRTEEGPLALYDLKADPLEMNNIVRDPQQKDIIAGFDRQIKEHMAATDDDWGIEAVFPPPDFQTHTDGAEYAKGLAEQAIVEP